MTLPELPSGRRLAVHSAGGEEALEVRSPDGTLEVLIRFTPAGAVVRVAAAKLEVAADELAVTVAGGVSVRAGEFRVTTDKSIHLNGETVRLNCTDAPPSAQNPGEPGA